LRDDAHDFFNKPVLQTAAQRQTQYARRKSLGQGKFPREQLVPQAGDGKKWGEET
jgi:hypothetical protein